jgi:PTS system mannose-specific IIB component
MKLTLPWNKERLRFPLVRVDDRLLHGQVVVGWGQQFGLERLILVSDRVRNDAAYASAMKSLAPPELKVEVMSLSEAAPLWESKEFVKSRTMLVLETTGDALKLHKQGVPLKLLIIGGLHFRETSEEFLPYVFLSRWDRIALDELTGQGVRVVCQDLPTAKPVPYPG